MVLHFATKRDINGNTYYLGIDTDRKVFAEQPDHILHKGDYIEVTKTARRELLAQCEKEGFSEWYTVTRENAMAKWEL